MSNIVLVQAASHEIKRFAAPYLELLNSLSQDELWSTDGNIPNSIGTITRHLTGNLNHYFGTGLLKNSYVRTRDAEFSDRGLAKAKVISDLQAALAITEQSLETVDPNSLDQPFTSPDGELFESLGLYIIHMAMHFAMHYGQADYAQNAVKLTNPS
jgi:hypothetical protein